MSDPVEELLNRANALARSGPGPIEVMKTTDVAFVRTVNALTSGLDDQLRERVRETIGEVELLLMGIDGDEVSLKDVRPWYRRGGILLYIDLIRAPKKTLSEMKAVHGQQQHNMNLMAAGGPKPRPAPVGLVKAAEAWLVANMSDPKVVSDQQLSDLSKPWTTAHVSSGTQTAE